LKTNIEKFKIMRVNWLRRGKPGSFSFELGRHGYDNKFMIGWTIHIETKGGENDKDDNRLLWWCYSSNSILNNKYHLTFQIPGVITIDTAHTGKRIIGRINLTRWFKNDYHVYSSGNSVQSQIG